MRYILIILVFLSVGAEAQMIIKAQANYRPYAAPVGGNLLLDDYPNAAAAYSLRKLDKDYSGSAIRVRRSNDNAESDIGFTSGGDLDTAALKTFVGANSGFIVTWYDQSGNARNATQSTAANQPFIVSSGVVQTILNKPTVVFLSASNFTVNFNGVSNSTHFHVAQTSTLNSASTLFLQGEVNNKWYLPVSNGSTGIIYSNVGTPTTYFNGVLNTATTQGQLYTNLLNKNVIASITNANTSTWTGINFDLTGTSAFESVRFRSELIIYNSDQSSNRTGIENNINDYYNIYWNGDFTGLLDTYGSSAAAYSLRNLSSTYTGPLIRVRRSNDNAEQDIYGDYYGNLDTVGLKNFVGANSGFVVTWYDQSGNSGRNATQSTAANQPNLVFNGTIRRYNNQPTLYFAIGNNFLQAYRFAAPNIDFSFSMIHEVQSTSSQTISFTDDYTGPGPANIRGTYFQPNTYVVSRSGAAVGVSSGVALQNFRLYANSVKYLSNNTAVASTNNTSSASTSMLMSGNAFTEGSTNLVLGRYQTSAALGLNGHISEFISYRGVNANIDAVRSNQITYFNIIL